MDFYIFGAICITVVTLIAFALVFNDNVEKDSQADHNLIVNDSDIELAKALDNLKVYNSATENSDYHWQ